MRCAKCGAENLERRKFCTQCGSPLAAKCPRCGAATQPGEKFCGECGAALETPPTTTGKSDEPQIRIAGTPAPENVDGERKIVTFLFADIKGSMDLIEDLDPEEAQAIVDPALKLMMEAVRHFGGYVAQSTGDGIFALFGAPVAHEDHPQRALYAALRMQEELKRYSDRIRAEGDLPIQARVGVNTGEVVVRSITTGEGRSEYVPVGHSTGIAARMQALAPVGSIAATERIRKVCEGYFLLKSLGSTKIKGVSEPVDVYEVTGLGPLRTRLQRAAGQGLTKFVGRGREMEALAHAAEQAKAGHGQIVGAMAEPGVGKSRLFFEFKAKNQAGWMVLEAFSVSYGKASAYLPVRDLLHTYFKIAPNDDALARRVKVTGSVLTLDKSLKDSLPYLFTLLGIVEGVDPLAQMDANVRRRRTLDAIKRILLRESLNQPLIAMFEDLHWMDEQTQEFLNLLADSLANAKILLLVNYRPEYSHQWGSKTYYAQLRLDPLGRESADEMLSALLGDAPEMVPLKRVILERTEGNPFFMEELIEALFEQGVLGRDGTVKVTRALNQLKIPQTVQGVLAARIDRLPPQVKELLQTLAVIGMEFPLCLVREVVQQPPKQVDHLLNDLQLGEFIYEQPTLGDTEFVFKHALTRQVAYDTLLNERRKQLHERIGLAIETLYQSHLREHASELGDHFASSSNISKAVEYLILAGEESLRRSTYSDAISRLTRARDLMCTLPDDPTRARSEMDLHVHLGEALWALRGAAAQEVERTYTRARELCETVGDDVRLISILAGLRSFHIFRLELSDALVLDRRMLELAERLKDPGMLVTAHTFLARTIQSTGNLATALEHSKRLMLIERPSHTRAGFSWEHRRTLGIADSAVTLWLMGYPDSARQRIDQALGLANDLGHSVSLASALTTAARFEQLTGDPGAAAARAEAAIEVTNEHGFSLELARAMTIRGWAQAMRGELEGGLLGIREGLAAYEALGARKSTWDLVMMADVLRLGGKNDLALEAATEGLAVAAETGERYFEPELLRIKADLIGKSNSAFSVAESCFRDALDLARQQGAKNWELRTATNLAQLLQDTNRRDEARAMLAEIYNWFTEGLDLRDLKDAKALLDELNERQDASASS